VKRALNKVKWHWQAVAGVLALVAGVTLAVLAAGEATRPQAEPPMVTSSGLAATASLSRRVLLFGDPLTARFDIVVDRRRLNPDLVRLETSFVPFTPVAEGRSRRDNGSLTELRYIFTLDCNEAACLPSMARKRQFVLSPARVLYREPARGGSLPAEVAIQMPSVEIASRLSATEVRMIQRRNPLRVLDGPTIGLGIEDATLLIRDSSSELPPATYRVSPYLLVALLFALAALLTVGAAIVLLSRLRSERPPPPPPPEPEIAGSPLEHALGQLELALADGQVGEQRKALELLGRELRHSGNDTLARDARQLAWAADAPVRSEASALAETVRASMNGSQGGQRS